MQEISIKTVKELTLEALGLNQVQYDVTSIEVVSAQLRRAAGFLCPCSPKTLVQAVVSVSKCLVDDLEAFKQKTRDVLEKMVAYGDLMEGDDWRSEGDERIAVLYRVPPGFVTRESGQFLLFGIDSNGKMPFPIDLERQVEQVGYVRWLKGGGDRNLAEQLLECGLTQVEGDTWLRLPTEMSCQDYLMGFDQRLAKSGNPGDLGPLSVIDPNTRVDYYRGRWRSVAGESGRFVGRRPRPYGADLWCYVELEKGQPARLLDLPIDATLNRGCDEVWRLQAAIDARSRNPQKVLAVHRPDGLVQLCFYSPLPMWVQRRLDVVGKPVAECEGCLFSYGVDKAEADHELDCLRRLMWMKIESR